MSNESEVRIFYLKVRMKKEYLADDALKFKLVNVLGYFRGVSYELYAFNVFDDEFSFLYGIKGSSGIREKDEERVRADLELILTAFFVGGAYPFFETEKDIRTAVAAAEICPVGRSNLVELVCYINLYAGNLGYTKDSGADWWWCSSCAYLTMDNDRNWSFIAREAVFRCLAGSIPAALIEMKKRHRSRERMGNPMPLCIMREGEAA